MKERKQPKHEWQRPISYDRKMAKPHKYTTRVMQMSANSTYTTGGAAATPVASAGPPVPALAEYANAVGELGTLTPNARKLDTRMMAARPTDATT